MLHHFALFLCSWNELLQDALVPYFLRLKKQLAMARYFSAFAFLPFAHSSVVEDIEGKSRAKLIGGEVSSRRLEDG